MPARARTDLIVRIAGRDWAVQTARQARDELAAWLGPWARGPVADHEGVAGYVSMAPAGTPNADRAIREPPGTFCIRSEGYHLFLTARGGHEHAVVDYNEGYLLTAARAALRVLVSRLVVAEGGLALHASSVRTPRGVLVFAGPSGAGKTSASEAFPASERLDSDLVLLAEKGGRWVRLDLFDEYEPRRFAPGSAAGLALRAVLVPAPADRFELRFLRGAEAVRACLHLPAAAATAQEGSSAIPVSNVLARIEGLARAVPVARLGWSLSDDLPALVEKALPQ